MINFNAGDVWVKESSGANPKTFKAAKLISASVDIEGSPVELETNREFAEDVASGRKKITGQIVIGEFQPAFKKAHFGSGGVAETTGYEEMVTLSEAPGVDNTITATGGGPIEDFGVRNASTRAEFVRVASAPATGQYSVNETTGAYTTAAADQAVVLEVTYAKAVAGSGTTLEFTNDTMGAAPLYKFRLWSTYRTNGVGLYLPAVVFLGMGMPFTSGEHSRPTIRFQAVGSPTEIGANGKPLVFKWFNK